jgi:hypothetical protein
MVNLAGVAHGILRDVLFISGTHVNLRVHILLEQVKSLFKQHRDVDSNILTDLASRICIGNLGLLFC